jgi:TRAP-type C4-dicarboxylate transport system permease small subunit
MRRLDDWLRTATRMLAVAGLMALFANAIAVVVDVLLRVLFAAPIDRLIDVSGMIFVVSAACCVPAATASRRHITIRALEGRLAPRARAAVEALAALLATIVFGLVTWQLGVYVGEVGAAGQTLSQIDIPVAPFWLFVTACLLLATMAQAVAFLDYALQAAGRAAPPGDGTGRSAGARAEEAGETGMV